MQTDFGWVQEELPVALRVCPRCGGETFITVHAGVATNFFCERCFFCWHMNGDLPSLVASKSCPGCELSALGCRCGALGYLRTTWGLTASKLLAVMQE